jgi:hypothetical protein
MLLNKSKQGESEIIDLFPQTKKEKNREPLHRQQRSLKRRLSDVILGARPFIKVHSDVLETDFWFVNEAMVNPGDSMFKGKTITMEMLAEIMMSRRPVLKTVEELFAESQ